MPKNPEAKRQWEIRNRDRLTAYRRAWAAAHPDEERARYARRYGGSRREVVLDRARRYRAAHREEIREYNKQYRPRQDAWRRAHPARVRTYEHASRARRRGAVGSHTTAEWLEKVELIGGVCFYCGRSDLALVREHKIPLCRGGSNAIANVVPACRSCNARKGTRTADEFLAEVA